MDSLKVKFTRTITVVEIEGPKVKLYLDDGQSWWVHKHDNLILNFDYTAPINPPTVKPAPVVEVRELKKRTCDRYMAHEPCNGTLMRKMFSPDRWYCATCKAEYE